MDYKLLNNDLTSTATAVTYTRENGSMVVVPFDPDNTDYQAYLKWLEEGNTPLPADEVTQ
jgi:hypothetical protein